LSSKLAAARSALSCHPPEGRLHRRRNGCEFTREQQRAATALQHDGTREEAVERLLDALPGFRPDYLLRDQEPPPGRRSRFSVGGYPI
jgi:hypothetical protein